MSLNHGKRNGMHFLKKNRLMSLLVVRYTPINGSDPPWSVYLHIYLLSLPMKMLRVCQIPTIWLKVHSRIWRKPYEIIRAWMWIIANVWWMGFYWHISKSIIHKETIYETASLIALCLMSGSIPGGVAPQQSSVMLQATMQSNKMQVNPPKMVVIFSTRFDL